LLAVPGGAGSDTLQIEALHAGQYLVAVDGTRHRVLANLFDPAESDVGRAAWEPESQTLVTPSTAGSQPRPDGSAGWFLGLAIGLLLVEWFTATRRLARREAS
jgi:hypothetical protein